MNKIGIIVDGPGDYSALKSRLNNGYKILKTDGPRGHCSTIDSIVFKSRKQINLLKTFKCKKIIILLDFECREVEFYEFASVINSSFSKQYTDIEVTACLANTMIENWFLADLAYLSSKYKFLKKVRKQKRYEGTHGKNEIKKAMQKGYSYNEITHGALLFEGLRFKEAKKMSPSLEFFLENVQITT